MNNIKTVIITGGARGIGKACAIELDKQGYNIVINYNTSKDEAETLIKQLNNAIAIQADISSFYETEKMYQIAYAHFGFISNVINNAGISQQKLFTDITDDDWDNMFAVNVKGTFNMCKAVLPEMIRRKCGKIVNLSSIWGLSGASCEVHYSSAKAAIIGLTKALAKEVAPSGINVNCVAPGAIMTDMLSSLGEQTLELIKEETPLGRLGTPQSIASAVAYLLSEQADFITGQVLSPNGGIVI